MALIGWDYKKQITLTGQANTGTDYQIKLLVGESSGSVSPDFHVENHANLFPSAKNVSGDIRFTADDNTTLLPFWVESVSGTTPNRVATIWVKVSADLGSNQNIYCYYKGTTTNVSNGDDTFILFDDFEGTSIDTSKWNVASGSAIISGSELTAPSANPEDTFNTSGKVTITTDANRGIAARFTIRRTGATDTGFTFRESATDFIRAGNTSYASNGVYNWGGGRYNMSIQSYGYNINGEYIYEQKIVGTSSTITHSGGVNSTRTLPATVNSRTFYFELFGGDSFYPINYVNFVIVRRFIATEPSFNVAGSEETNGTTNTTDFFNFF